MCHVNVALVDSTTSLPVFRQSLRSAKPPASRASWLVSGSDGRRRLTAPTMRLINGWKMKRIAYWHTRTEPYTSQHSALLTSNQFAYIWHNGIYLTGLYNRPKAAEPNLTAVAVKSPKRFTACRKNARKKRRFSRLNFRMIAVIFENSDTCDPGNSFCDSWFHKYDRSTLHNKQCDL